MKRTATALLVAMLLPGVLLAQTRWQTTRQGQSGGECRLVSTKLAVAVGQYHCDIEEEAIIAPLGNVGWGDDQSLEIVGQFTMTQGTAVRSMLLWNGNQILKAKLKDRTVAQAEYEEVVGREVVRDPAIIEYLGNNQYRYRIFPVAIDASRRIRILYTVAFKADGSNGPSFEISPAFLQGMQTSPSEIPVTFDKKDSLVSDIVLSVGQSRRTVRLGAQYLMRTADLQGVTYNYYNRYYQTPFALSFSGTAEPRSYFCRVAEGATMGYYTALFTPVPNTIRTYLQEYKITKYTLDAAANIGSLLRVTDIPDTGLVGLYVKASAAWNNVLSWSCYDTNGEVLVSCEQKLDPAIELSGSSMLPLCWASKHTLDKGSDNMGALYGFVDYQMSLLALESDALPGATADLYREGGVPPLDADEILVSKDDAPIAPLNDIIFEYGMSSQVAVDNVAVALSLKVSVRGGVLYLDGVSGELTDAALLDMSGRLVHRWSARTAARGSIALALPGSVRGTYLLRLRIGSATIQRIVTVR